MPTQIEIFSIGFDLFQVVGDTDTDRFKGFSAIKERLKKLGIQIPGSDQFLAQPELDAGFCFQLFIEKILGEIRIKYDEETACYFKLPVNVFVAFAHLPIKDLWTIEKPLDSVLISNQLREEFRDLKGEYEQNFLDGNDVSPLFQWIEKVNLYLRISGDEKSN